MKCGRHHSSKNKSPRKKKGVKNLDDCIVEESVKEETKDVPNHYIFNGLTP